MATSCLHDPSPATDVHSAENMCPDLLTRIHWIEGSLDCLVSGTHLPFT